jgi:glycine/D-amino acid oxidase-like deaminating enzyme
MDYNSWKSDRAIPVIGEYDVVVCGGGPAGCAAALSARRTGLSVLLLESQGQLGGMGTSGLVSHWLGGRTANGSWIVGGIFREFSEEAAEQGIALLPRQNAEVKYQPHGWLDGLVHGIPFDPFAMAAYLDRKMISAGVKLLFGTQVADAMIVDGRITRLLLANKAGLQTVSALAVIDATGDADVAARTGCPTVLGRDADHLMTPATLMFHVDNVDQEALSAYIHAKETPRFKELIQHLRSTGEWTFPYEIFISLQMQEPGVLMINTSRLVGVDGTDPRSLTQGLIQGREETRQLLALMRKHIPGCAQARIKAVATSLGVRETRRIVGDYVLSVDDLVTGKSFADTIGLSGYGWDLPDPKRPSHQPMEGRKAPYPTPIPYRVMLPRAVKNLICPGRAISVERDVLGPLRVMAPCMAMGEAAGLAAQQVVTRELAFANVDIAVLQTTLRAQGAILDWEA